MAEFTQARVRVNEEGARIVRIALERYDEFLRDARSLAVNDKPFFNRQLAATRRVIAEVERTIEEHHWDDEPELADEG